MCFATMTREGTTTTSRVFVLITQAWLFIVGLYMEKKQGTFVLSFKKSILQLTRPWPYQATYYGADLVKRVNCSIFSHPSCVYHMREWPLPPGTEKYCSIRDARVERTFSLNWFFTSRIIRNATIFSCPSAFFSASRLFLYQCGPTLMTGSLGATNGSSLE